MRTSLLRKKVDITKTFICPIFHLNRNTIYGIIKEIIILQYNKCLWKGIFMYQCISDFAKSERENGLLLLDMPTGFGKTYSVIKYIADFIADEKNKDKKIFFITTLKKNLPMDELKKQLDKMGLGHLFDERVLKLEPNSDTAVANYSRSMLDDIPLEIRRSEEFKHFRDDIDFLQNNAKSSFYESIKDNFKTNNEYKFRMFLQKILSVNFPTLAEKLYAIKTDSAWQWVGKLYPSVFTRERQVIMMSMDKFICPHSSVVEKPYVFYNNSITNGALVFIDEFDATKETVLKNIIENGLKEKIDYIELFNHIYAVLQSKTFPERFFVPSEKRQNSVYRSQSLKGIMKKLKEMADDIFYSYSLQFNHKTENDGQSESNFLFHDHRFISVLNGKNRYISTYSDPKDSINRIAFTTNKPESQNSIQNLLNNLRGFITWFQTTVFIYADNYYFSRKERMSDGEEEFTYESAIHSVLTEFNLGSTYENYLFSQIMMMRIKNKNDIAGSEYDLSLYEKGFRYYSFENSPNHEFKSVISMVSYSQTPERILVKMCEKTKVVGISATATLPSVLCNYDLQYLSLKMGNAYLQISQDDRERLKNAFAEAQKGYKDIEIKTELFDSANFSPALWNNIFDSQELANAAHSEVMYSLSNNENKSDTTYQQERYYKIALAFKRFMENKEIRSFLCLLNKMPKPNDRELDTNILYRLFSYIVGVDVNAIKNFVFLLDGLNFDEKKNQLISRLSAGEKLFVISAYQTIGAGQNIQYDIPAEIKDSLVKTNDWNASSQKDFDAIYLDSPTHLSVYLGENNIEDKDFVRFIFETEYLQENAEISEETARGKIKAAFERWRCVSKKYCGGYKETPSVMYYATKQIVQAIGRMCRTNMKQKQIYIFADAQICGLFQVCVADNRLLNPEVLALIEAIKVKGAADTTSIDLIGKAELCSVRVNKFIHNMLKNEWSDTKMKQWNYLRELALLKPTASEADFVISQFYVEMDEPRNRYYYSQNEDYNKIKVSFVPTADIKQEVSEQAAKLDRIMLFHGMKEFFEGRGWATSFDVNKYNMSATFFNNIYKGALGEFAGWYWFAKELDIRLDTIDDPEIFEMFDYVVPNQPIYVDFKNWQETTVFDESAMIDKVIRKAKHCNAKCVIVANLISETEYKVKVTHHEGITLVQCPSLMRDNITSVDVDEAAAREIRRWINEISNQNE